MWRYAVFVFLVLVSLIDLPILFGVHRKINEVLVERGAQRLIVLNPCYLLLLQLFQLSLVGLLYSRLRKCNLSRLYTLGSAIFAAVLLLRIFYVGYETFTVPYDRARLLKTGVRVQALSEALFEYKESHSAFPEFLNELGVPRASLYDAWGCRFEYRTTDNAAGFRLDATCVPNRLSWMDEKYRRCFVAFAPGPPDTDAGQSRGP